MKELRKSDQTYRQFKLNLLLTGYRLVFSYNRPESFFLCYKMTTQVCCVLFHPQYANHTWKVRFLKHFYLVRGLLSDMKSLDQHQNNSIFLTLCINKQEKKIIARKAWIKTMCKLIYRKNVKNSFFQSASWKIDCLIKLPSPWSRLWTSCRFAWYFSSCVNINLL